MLPKKQTTPIANSLINNYCIISNSPYGPYLPSSTYKMSSCNKKNYSRPWHFPLSSTCIITNQSCNFNVHASEIIVLVQYCLLVYIVTSYILLSFQEQMPCSLISSKPQQLHRFINVRVWWSWLEKKCL